MSLDARADWEQSHDVHLSEHALDRWAERTAADAVPLQTAYEQALVLTDRTLQAKFKCDFPPRLYETTNGRIVVLPVRADRTGDPDRPNKVVPTALVAAEENDFAWQLFLKAKAEQFRLQREGDDR